MSVETLCLIVAVLSLFVSIRFGLYVMRREERQERERIAAAKQLPPQPEVWENRYRKPDGTPADGLRIQEDNEPQGPFFNNHFGGHFP